MRSSAAGSLSLRDHHARHPARCETLANLLEAGEAPALVAPAAVAAPDTGVRFQFRLGVDDVDETAAELKHRGVELLNGPMDRPRGIRTASFRDPGGHVWEIAC